MDKTTQKEVCSFFSSFASSFVASVGRCGYDKVKRQENKKNRVQLCLQLTPSFCDQWRWRRQMRRLRGGKDLLVLLWILHILQLLLFRRHCPQHIVKIEHQRRHRSLNIDHWQQCCCQNHLLTETPSPALEEEKRKQTKNNN